MTLEYQEIIEDVEQNIEYWKDIPNYEGLYQASTHGNIRSLNYKGSKVPKVLALRRDKHGYLDLLLCKKGIHKREKVHRLVAKTFIPNPDNYPQINHKDENPANNFVSNLEWCDSKYNINYGNRAAKFSETRGCKIIQCDLNGAPICEWRSIRYAAKCLNLHDSNIHDVIIGKQQTCGGYIWKKKTK